ncbi:MAG: Protein-export membrane protein SecF [Anaerolineales bacterium]|nr:Protein-export membrane protein SecF [Anaerolineales bacterium]
MINIVGRRYLYFLISALVIVPGLIGLIVWGPPTAGIDFTGGNLLEIRFEAGRRPAPAEVVALASQMEIDGPVVQTAGETDLVVRSKPFTDEQRAELLAALEAAAGSVVLLRDEHVGPSIGAEVGQRALGAVALAVLGILGYITYAFRGVPHATRYGVAAILAMLHDVLVVISVQVLVAHFFGWEIDSLFLTALLTVIGFSVHDTIVVFDRIRENQRLYRRLPYETMVNHSIVQTLARSINTQLTVMLTLLALLLFGGVTMQHFVTILLVGVLSGTYSSIFNAAPILVVWENREWRTWFRPRRATA